MKHKWWVISLLLLLFILAQVIGLIVSVHYTTGADLPLGIERPEVNPETSYISLFLILLVATGMVLILLHFRLFLLWRIWFLVSVFLTLVISFGVFFSASVALVFAIIFSVWRVFKPNPIVHNLTELFIYGALAAIFVPLLTLFSVSALLILISVYDYIAVRKTAHMIKLAKSQGEAKVFAGLLIPYENNVALLGGGDIGFPLLFAAVSMNTFGLGMLDWRAYIIPVCAGLLLFALFVKGEKKKYYPAMPYVSLGCLLGLVILLLVL
ncbi:MAG: presenilin family intramembrane aspartyl protease [bacterium]|nr:presenilin family intramembrane aspartyl protease [bacterium]